ncbi:MAG: hypothetical protein ACJ73V_12750, partial [Acidimicrobiia bacterium]
RAREETTVPLGTVIVNRVLPEPFTTEDEPVFAALDSDDAARVLHDAVGPGADGVLDAARLAVALRRSRVGSGATAVLDAARLAVSLRRTRAVHLAELREAVELPMLYLPYLFVRDQGLRVTTMVADALAQELGL